MEHRANPSHSLQWRDIRGVNPIELSDDALLEMAQAVEYRLQSGFFDATSRMEAVLRARTLRYELSAREQEGRIFRRALQDDECIAATIDEWRSRGPSLPPSTNQSANHAR